MKQHTRTITVITFFAIAMAALEGAVVVYLRALYYPGEFTVALKLIDERILLVEIARELATLVMLVAIGFLAGKNLKERFAYFLISFAVWDIFYYLWLKVFIDWPASILDWDILFLIPITWLGPVAAPVICSLTMMILAIVMLKSTDEKGLSTTVWSLLVAGSLIILFTFLKDYTSLVISNGFLDEYLTILQNQEFVRLASNFIPAHYSWGWFWTGEVILLFAIVKVYLEQSPNRGNWSMQSIK